MWSLLMRNINDVSEINPSKDDVRMCPRSCLLSKLKLQKLSVILGHSNGDKKQRH